jgi:futalosine hydrolase
VLVPTALELERFRDQGGLAPGTALVELSGFGPVAAAARTAALLASLRPRRVLLVGIAGTYDEERFPVGSARSFDAVAIDGIGVGEGAGFRGPRQVGFPQWPGEPDGSPIDDTLALAPPAGFDEGLLLTACAASDSSAQARERRARHPRALAEDMEGFAVAFACALAYVPCAIVRGASNTVGDRDPRHWRVAAALADARRRALELLAADEAEARA